MAHAQDRRATNIKTKTRPQGNEKMGKFLSAMALMAAGIAPTLANAQCYSVYDRDNQLIFQDTQSPIDMRQPVAEAIRKRFAPGAHLVFTPAGDDCTLIDKTAAPKALPSEQPGSDKR